MSVLTYRNLASILLSLLLLGQIQPLSLGQQISTSNLEKRRRVEKAADLFNARFRKTFDLGGTFEAMAVSNVMQLIQRSGELKSFGLSETLASEIDDATARRFYSALLTFTGLRGAYMFSRTSMRGSERVLPEKAKSEPVPRGAGRIIRRSYLKYVYAEEGSPEITTVGELQRFINALEQVSMLYRKSLSRNAFNSRGYKEAVTDIEGQRDHQFMVTQGESYYGIGEDVEVYQLCRGTFCFKFIEENGKMKVLALLFGD